MFACGWAAPLPIQGGRERICSGSDVITLWIPACAGMTERERRSDGVGAGEAVTGRRVRGWCLGEEVRRLAKGRGEGRGSASSSERRRGLVRGGGGCGTFAGGLGYGGGRGWPGSGVLCGCLHWRHFQWMVMWVGWICTWLFSAPRGLRRRLGQCGLLQRTSCFICPFRSCCSCCSCCSCWFDTSDPFRSPLAASRGRRCGRRLRW